jgi:uncharacterized repeat protein (TIGR03803 family)
VPLNVTTLRLSLPLALATILGTASLPAKASTFTVLYSFTGGSDGAVPTGGVISDASGNLYGETNQAGDLACTSTVGQPSLGCGTVYSLSPTTGLKVLLSFAGPNGAYGNNGLTLKGSTLYGSTTAGGTNDDGVLFSVHTDGSSYTLLHQFAGSDGKAPAGSLQSGPGGVFYGVTQYGGSSNNGVLFEIKPNGTYTILHSFTGGADGAQPNSLLYNAAGEIVGSTTYGGTGSKNKCAAGCGIVYTYTPATGKFDIAHNFTGGTSGGQPYVGSFGPGPVVYGTTGPMFSIGQKTGYSVVGKYNESLDGEAVRSGPLYDASNASLIGVFSNGPSSFLGLGDLYSVQNGVITVLYGFAGGSDGYAPYAQPILTSTGAIIGTNTGGGAGCYTCGDIWEYTP